MTFSPFEKGLGYKTFFPKFVVNGNWLIFFLSGCSFMTQQREFRPNKLCNIPTLTIWISRIYLPSPVNSISLCLRKHTCNYHPYTCLDTTFALTKICLLCVKTNYKFLFPFKTMNVFKLLSSCILRRPQNFEKSPPYFWLALHRTKVRWRFLKILWPSQNIWTLLRKLLCAQLAHFT